MTAGASARYEAERAQLEADEYARFRAITEARGTWPGWPDRLRARDVRAGDFDEAVARYHVFVQWLAERQLADATERARGRGVSLYLDLPLGVHPDGFDVWRDRALFARGASAGAPPDALAPRGQDWGFPPLHPEAGRLDGHRYFVACIRKHLRFAKVLRIDHVMQLHRMFWVPDGDARQGVYVRYPAEDLLRRLRDLVIVKAVPDAPVGPHPVTFRLTNAGSAPVSVWQSCVLTHAITACIDESLASERARDDMSSSKDRPSAMHSRTGDPCPDCGDTVRAVSYSGYTVNYCPACQTGGKVLADNTTSRFLR